MIILVVIIIILVSSVIPSILASYSCIELGEAETEPTGLNKKIIVDY